MLYHLQKVNLEAQNIHTPLPQLLRKSFVTSGTFPLGNAAGT
jgi:hypothetical protein